MTLFATNKDGTSTKKLQVYEYMRVSESFNYDEIYFIITPLVDNYRISGSIYSYHELVGWEITLIVLGSLAGAFLIVWPIVRCCRACKRRR